MKSYTRAGFLYYQLTQINKSPSIIICSDKETISQSFANEEIRINYIQDLTQDLSNVGVTLYQVPYTATWINLAVVLSVRALQSSLIVIEFPWNFELQFKYTSLDQRNTVYEDILTHLKAASPSGVAIATTEKTGIVKPDGTTITITEDGTITSVGGSSVTGEKYGIRGDYSTRYGILECPNGILTYTGKVLTLKGGVKLQCAGQDIRTIIANDLTHTVTSTTDFDLFYISGGVYYDSDSTNLLECSDIFYQETEPEDGEENCVAWWNPKTEVWSFKSNKSGNVWQQAIACRLAHIHNNEENITSISYIGNRVLDDEIFAEKKDLSNVAFSGSYNDLENKPTIPTAYELPTASNSTLGGVKVGTGLAITDEGVLSTTGNYVEKTLTEDGYLSLPKTQVSESFILQNGNTNLSLDFSNGIPQIGVVGKDILDFVTPIEFAVKNPTINSELTYAQLSNSSILTKAQVIEAIKMYSPTIYNNVVLTSSVKDDGDTNYPYLNTFNIEDAKVTSIPTVTLSSDQVISGNYSSVTESIEGAITIRTKVELETGTTIPQVILQPTF